MGLKLQRANINLVENRLILAPEWGSITGDITEQEDLNQILTSVNSELETLDNSLNTTNTNLANLEQTTEGINNRLSGVEQTYATKSELNQLSTDLENLTDSALTEQDADNKYALKNGSNSEEFKAQSLYIAPYSIQVEGGELSFFHNGSRTNIHLPEDMGSGTVALTKNYYDKTEIDNKLSNLDLSIFEIVNELPTTNINENKIYLVRNDQTTGSNLYTEYRYTNNSWEVLGEYKSDVDLADYYTKSETDSLLANKADTADVYNKAEIDDLIASGSSDLFIVDLYRDGGIRSPYTYEEVLEQYNMGKIIVFRYTYVDGKETFIGSTYHTGLAQWRPQGTPNFQATIPVGKYLYTYTLYQNNDRVSYEQFTPIDNSALTNYYTKSNTYSKSEIDTKIGDIESILATL